MLGRTIILIFLLSPSIFSLRIANAMVQVSAGYAVLQGAYVIQEGVRYLVLNPGSRNMFSLALVKNKLPFEISALASGTKVEVCARIELDKLGNGTATLLDLRPLYPLERMQSFDGQLSTSASRATCVLKRSH